MNVSIFPSAFHPHIGGVEELARQLAHQLIRTGRRASIFTNRWPKNLPALESYEGLLVHRHIYRVPERNWRQLITSLIFTGVTLRKLEDAMRAQRPDIIHLQCVSSNSYYAVRMRRRLKVPLVVTLQGELTMDAGGLFQRSKFAQTLLRDALNEADVITGCSQKTLADAEGFYGNSFENRGRVIFNAARCDDFENAEPHRHTRPYIFAIGRVVVQKGFDILLEALAESEAHDHDLIIAGDGSEMASLRQMACELGIQNRVHFLGRADREQVPGLFCGASFVVLPSRSDEGLPVVCSEAMAAGKAILATRSGGVPEAVLDGETGIIVERGDVAGLARGISRLAGDSATRDAFAAAGRERARAFSWPVVTEQYVEAYEDARRTFDDARDSFDIPSKKRRCLRNEAART